MMTIRLFGVNDVRAMKTFLTLKAGNSVMCHVLGFLPYFYIPAPIGFQRDQLQPLQVALEVFLLKRTQLIFREPSLEDNLAYITLKSPCERIFGDTTAIRKHPSLKSY